MVLSDYDKKTTQAVGGGKIPATHIVGKQQEKQAKKKKKFYKEKNTNGP